MRETSDRTAIMERRWTSIVAVTLRALALAGVIGFGAVTTLAVGDSRPAFALGDEPQPVIDCRKKRNQTRPECQKSNSDEASQAARPTDDAIYAAAYALAGQQRYAEARELLKSAADQSVPRILNMLGFTSRKLGEMDVAIAFYRDALAVKPDYPQARAYFGEALLAQGDRAGAEAQLAMIAALCGTDCDAYEELAAALSAAQ
ncbi:MAG: tetratricopeptide repeat protein [Hyphomicrobiaceae bacterium]